MSYVKRAAIYTRVSTQLQKNNYSIETQLEACRNYAASKNYHIVAEFSETDSGGKLERKKLTELRQLVSSGKVDVVVCYEIDRVARNMAYQMLLEDEFKRYNVPIEYVHTVFSDTPEGQFQKHIHAVVAEYEREKIKERLMRGRTAKAESGLAIRSGLARYGYRYVGQGKHEGAFEIVPEEAEIVKLIFSLYVNGLKDGETVQRLGLRQIAKYLTDRGIPTKLDTNPHHPKKSERGAWSMSSVRNILKCEIYAGTAYYNTRDTYTDADGKNRKRASDRENWIPIPAPAIVSRKDWEAAQLLLKQNSSQSLRNTKAQYLLRGRCKCKTCGYMFRVDPARKRIRKNGHETLRTAYYRCNGSKGISDIGNHKKTCFFSVNAKRLDDIVWRVVKYYLQNPNAILDAMRKDREIQNDQRRIAEHSRDAAKLQIQNLQHQADILLQRHLEGDIDIERYKEKNQQLKAAIATQDNIVQDSERRIKKAREIEDNAEFFKNLRRCKVADLDLDRTLTFEEKLHIIHMLNLEVTLIRGETMEDSKLELTGYLPVTLVYILSANLVDSVFANSLIPFTLIVSTTF